MDFLLQKGRAAGVSGSPSLRRPQATVRSRAPLCEQAGRSLSLRRRLSQSGHGSGRRGRLRLLAVPHPLQERPRAPSHGHVQGRRRRGRRNRRDLQGRRHPRRPRRAALRPQRRPGQARREASRPRLLPRRRLRGALVLRRGAPRVPQRAGVRGPGGGRVRRLPPRARAPGARRLGGATLGRRELRRRRCRVRDGRRRPVAGRARRRRAPLRRRRQLRRQHRAQRDAQGRRQRPPWRRADRGDASAAPVLPRPGAPAVGAHGPQAPAEGGAGVGVRLRLEVRARPPVRQSSGFAGGGVGEARLPACAGDRGRARHAEGQRPAVRGGAEGQRVGRGGGPAARDGRRGARLLHRQIRRREGEAGDGGRRGVRQATEDSKQIIQTIRSLILLTPFPSPPFFHLWALNDSTPIHLVFGALKIQ